MIITPRLRLRRWADSDRDAFAQMKTDPEVMHDLGVNAYWAKEWLFDAFESRRLTAAARNNPTPSRDDSMKSRT